MAIQCSELRVGNYVKGIALGMVHKIDLHFFNECYDDETMLDWYSPIPLTEQILIDCGFVESKKGISDNGWYCKEYEAFGDEGTGIEDSRILSHTVEVNVKSFWANIYNVTYDEQGVTPKQKIKHLHQLQNLYYSLTGEELIYNPNKQP